MSEPIAVNSARFEGQIELDGRVEDVFELFSPLGEAVWVPGWAPELLHPPGASWAVGSLFRTHEEQGDAVWIVTSLDRQAHEVEYYRVEPGRWVARVAARCQCDLAFEIRVDVDYEYVGLSEAGNAEISAMTAADFADRMRRWRQWIAGCRRPGVSSRLP